MSLLLCSKSIGQTKFQIKPSASEIGREDVLQVEYEVSGTMDASNFAEPVFTQWKVLSGPSLTSQQISINGKTTASVSYVYSLQARASGRLVLPGSSITADGKTINCTAASITVKNTAHVAGASKPSTSLQLPGGFFQEDISGEDEMDKSSVLQPGETIASKIKNNIFVKVFANKTSCVVGEPLLIEYKLYTRLHSQSKVSKQPAFNGCSVYEMTTEDMSPQIEYYNGKNYKIYIIRKVQLFPLQSGDIKLDTASVDNEITLYKRNNSGFADTETKTVTLSSEPLTIHVKDLPERNKPADFNGTIGKFTISTQVNKLIDTADENNILQISIEGEGNFQTINCPTVNWPGNADHFDYKEKTDLNKLVFPASGNKTFEIPFVAKLAGKLIIPPVHFTYLDINTQQYKTVSSDSIVIDIAPALKNKIEKSKVSEDITNHKYIWIVPSIALLAGLVWWMNHGRKVHNKKAVNLDKETNLTERGITNDQIQIEREEIAPATGTFSERLNELLLSEDDKTFYTLARKLATETLLSENDELKRNELKTTIKKCDEALYFPGSAVNKDEVFRSMENII
jgi:hypothetical protein